jgi:hypothetical protein
MSPTGPDRDCVAVHDDLALLALGGLTGRRRAELLTHMEGCASCEAELEDLSMAADALISLIPEATPPEGFAARTVAAMHAESRTPSRPVIRYLVAAAALVLVLGLGIGVGSVVSPSGSSGHTAALTAAIHSSTGANGTVILSPGPNSWLVMTLDDAPTSGWVSCAITTANGGQRVIGRFSLSAGYGSWAARLPVTATSVRSVQILDSTGAIIASARLPE